MSERNKPDLRGELLNSIRDRFETAITSLFGDSNVIELPVEYRLPGQSMISFENTNGEMIAALLTDKGIAVTTGSRCGGHGLSVLTEMKIPYSQAMGTVTFSFSTETDVDELVQNVVEAVSLVRSFA
jgi:cysteine sulfinate desulfinase/cysteine desulfurase-like protein